MAVFAYIVQACSPALPINITILSSFCSFTFVLFYILHYFFSNFRDYRMSQKTVNWY